jgi:hypothetical protein
MLIRSIRRTIQRWRRRPEDVGKVRVHAAVTGSLLGRLVLVNHVCDVMTGAARAPGRRRR